jgi:hypothetical protein
MEYRYETPMWIVIILCSVAVSVSMACLLAFNYWDQWAGDAPPFIKWLLLVMSFVFLTAGLRPNNWKPWRYFYADDSGIHFPSECPETKSTEWLTVPWERVGKIRKETFVSRHKGPSIELLISDHEINRFFRDVKLTRAFFNNEISQNEYFKVGYSNLFQKADRAVRILNEYLNFARVGGLQSQGAKGEAVVGYREPLATLNLKSSGTPEG